MNAQVLIMFDDLGRSEPPYVVRARPRRGDARRCRHGVDRSPGWDGAQVDVAHAAEGSFGSSDDRQWRCAGYQTGHGRWWSRRRIGATPQRAAAHPGRPALVVGSQDLPDRLAHSQRPRDFLYFSGKDGGVSGWPRPGDIAGILSLAPSWSFGVHREAVPNMKCSAWLR